MSKQSLILAVLLLSQAFAFGQELSKDFEVSVATPYDVIDAGSKEYISMDNGTLIFAKMSRGVVYIQKMDVNAMKEIARNTYDDLPKKAVFQDVIRLGDKIFYIYEAYDRKAKNFKVYSREIDPENATFKEQRVIIETSRKVVDLPMTQNLSQVDGTFSAFKAKEKFKVYTSFDKSKVMINYRSYPLERNDAKNKDDIGFFVFDSDMNKIWGKEVKMPYTEKEINNIEYAVTNSGEARMLVGNRTKKKYEIFLIDHNGKLTPKELDLSTDYFLRELKIRENDEGNLMCGGFYANGIEFTYNPFTGGQFIFNANGLLYFQIDSEGNLVKKDTYEFSEEFIQQNLSERQKKTVAKREEDGKAGILDLFLLDFIVKEDGAYFIGERQYLRNEFYHGPKKENVYHFSNIIMLKVNNDGSLAWMKKLPKNQEGLAGCGQMSYAFMQNKGSDYIAFVDNPKNIELSPDDGVPEPHLDGKGGFLTTYKVDNATGKLEKHTICDMNDIDGYKAYQFKTWRITKAGEGIFIMEIYIKRKKDTFVKFELK